MNSNPLESTIERIVCEYARSKDWLVYKFSAPNMRSVPDRLMIAPSGFILFCEFKRAGKLSTGAQLREHQRLMAHNAPVFVIDNVEAGKKMVDYILSQTASK